MEMKKLHMGTVSYGFDSMDEVAHQLAMAFGNAEQGQYAQSVQCVLYSIWHCRTWPPELIADRRAAGHKRTARYVFPSPRRCP